jgi:hypothetical protein
MPALIPDALPWVRVAPVAQGLPFKVLLPARDRDMFRLLVLLAGTRLEDLRDAADWWLATTASDLPTRDLMLRADGLYIPVFGEVRLLLSGLSEEESSSSGIGGILKRRSEQMEYVGDPIPCFDVVSLCCVKESPT